MAIIEAMAFNIPVVTTKTNGSNDICVHGSNSMVVKYDEDKEKEFIEESLIKIM